MQEGGASLGDQLAQREKILQMQIALNAAQGQTDFSDKLQAAAAALNQTLLQWKSIDLGNAAQSIEQAATKIPQALGQSLASGIFGGGKKGEDIGTQVSKALANIGKNLFGQLVTMAIEKLIATIVTQTAVATPQLAATTANTAALIANTTALGASAGAGGISAAGGAAASAAGGVANGASGGLVAAAGGIIGGVISAVSTWIGDNKIVKAIDGTTAAVLSLRGNIGASVQLQGGAAGSGTQSNTSQNSTSSTNPFLNALTGGSALDVNIVSISPLAVLAGFTHLFGLAEGTNSAPGGWSMVGEKGPEIMHVPRGAEIIPNHAIHKYADGTPGTHYQSTAFQTGTTNLSFHAHGMSDPERFIDHVMRKLPETLKRRSPQFSPLSR